MSAYLEVNVKKIQELINFANKTVLGNFKNKITVVKGNGYGHDVNLIVPLAVKAGSSILAVARVDEGIEVRNILNKLKSKLPILCLGIIDECNYATCIKNDISVPIANLDQAKRVAKLNIKGLKVH
jgi:alanine racemase